MKWLLVLKDHHTKIIYLRAISSKAADCVAYELDHIFGFIGFPLTFHTDNGKEFIAKNVLDMVREWNPNCHTVTGRVRTPRDQGSVENVNKMVKRVLSSLGTAKRQKGETENWVLELGRAMATINTHKPSGKMQQMPIFMCSLCYLIIHILFQLRM